MGRAHGTRLFSSSGLSALENVLTPRQHMLAQQYRGCPSASRETPD